MTPDQQKYAMVVGVVILFIFLVYMYMRNKKNDVTTKPVYTKPVDTEPVDIGQVGTVPVVDNSGAVVGEVPSTLPLKATHSVTYYLKVRTNCIDRLLSGGWARTTYYYFMSSNYKPENILEESKDKLSLRVKTSTGVIMIYTFTITKRENDIVYITSNRNTEGSTAAPQIIEMKAILSCIP